MNHVDGYDDDDATDRRAARVLRRYRDDLDQATTPSEMNRATDRLLSGLAQARMTRNADN